MANADNGSTPSGSVTKKSDHPWLDVPAFDQKGEELMQENVSQLRKVCRAARTDNVLIKDLMKKTYTHYEEEWCWQGKKLLKVS